MISFFIVVVRKDVLHCIGIDPLIVTIEVLYFLFNCLALNWITFTSFFITVILQCWAAAAKTMWGFRERLIPKKRSSLFLRLLWHKFQWQEKPELKCCGDSDDDQRGRPRLEAVERVELERLLSRLHARDVSGRTRKGLVGELDDTQRLEAPLQVGDVLRPLDPCKSVTTECHWHKNIW